jgi:hypothetical protein
MLVYLVLLSETIISRKAGELNAEELKNRIEPGIVTVLRLFELKNTAVSSDVTE